MLRRAEQFVEMKERKKQEKKDYKNNDDNNRSTPAAVALKKYPSRLPPCQLNFPNTL